MSIRVMHADEPTFRTINADHVRGKELVNFATTSFNWGHYQEVAVVDTLDLDRAYELTNNINRSWTENDGLTAFRKEARSTSIGDIMVLVDGTTIKTFVVDSVGFKELPL